MKTRLFAYLVGVLLPAASLHAQPSAAISSAHFVGRVKGGTVLFDVRMSVTSTKDRWHAVKLFPANAGIQKTGQLTGSAQLRRDATGFSALLPGKGTYALNLGLAVPVRTQGKQSSIRVPLPRNATVSIEVTAPGRDLAFETSPASPISVQESADGSLAAIYPPATPEVTIRWLPKHLAKELACVYSLDESSHFAIEPGGVKRRASLHFYVARGQLRKAALTVPNDATVLKVQGDDVESWHCTKTAAGKRVEIRLAKPKTGRYDMWLWTERPTPLPPASFSIEPVQDSQATHQRGYMAIQPIGAITAREQSRRAATLFDVRTLDGDFVDVKFDTKLAYRFRSANASVALTVAVARPKLRATSSTFVMLERGIATLTSRFDYDVRDAGVYQLRLKLTEGLSVVEVKGKSIKDWDVDGTDLIVSLRHKVEGRYQLSVSAQQIFQKVNGIAIPRIESNDADEETGHIGVQAGAGVYLQHHAATKTRQVEPKELPKWLRSRRPRLAYVYRNRDGTLSVSTVKVEPELTAQLYTYVDIGEERLRRETLAVCKIRRAGIFDLRLGLPAGLTVTDVQGPFIDDWAVSDDGGQLRIGLTKEVKGAYHFQVFGEQLATDRSKIPIGGLAIGGASKVEGWLGLGTGANLELRTTAAKGLSPSRLRDVPKVLRAQEGMALAFRFTERPWQIGLRAVELEPRIEVNTFTVLRFRQGNLAVETDLHYDIQKAGVSGLTLALPANAINSDVRGDDIAGKELKDGTWHVDLDQRKRGPYALHVSYDVVLPTGEGRIAHTGIRAVGAVRQVGKVVVCQERSDVSVSLDKAEGLGATELSPQERQRIALPVISAFHYSAPDRRLQFAVAGQHLSESLLQASMPSCQVYSLVKRDGMAIHYLTGAIHNVKKQYLTVSLGKDANLWGTYMVDRKGAATAAGDPVKPTVIGPGTYTIPLLTTDRRARSIALIWSEPLARLGAARTVDFKTPKFDVPVHSTKWQVLMPSDYQIASVDGNMKVEELRRQATFLGAARHFAMQVWSAIMPGPGALVVWGGVILLGVAVVWAVRRKRQQGYLFPEVTLGVSRPVGVLAVVAIIAVLAATLLPSLNRARESAKATSCITNLKQIGLAVQMYTSDHDGYFPWHAISARAPVHGAPSWYDLCVPYTESTEVFHSVPSGRPFTFVGHKTHRVSNPSERMIIVSPGPEHNHGRNVLYEDGHVTWMPEEKFRSEYRKQTGGFPPRVIVRDTSSTSRIGGLAAKVKNMFAHSTAKLGGDEDDDYEDAAPSEGGAYVYKTPIAGEGWGAGRGRRKRHWFRTRRDLGPAGAEESAEPRAGDQTESRAAKSFGVAQADRNNLAIALDIDRTVGLVTAKAAGSSYAYDSQTGKEKGAKGAPKARLDLGHARHFLFREAKEAREGEVEQRREAEEGRREEQAKQSYNLALALGRKGNYAQAVDELKRAIDLNGDLKQAKQQLERFKAIQEAASESLAQQKATAPKKPISTSSEMMQKRPVQIADEAIVLGENGGFKSEMRRRKRAPRKGAPSAKVKRRVAREHLRTTGESAGAGGRGQRGQAQGGAGGAGGFVAGKKIVKDAREGKPGGPMKVAAVGEFTKEVALEEEPPPGAMRRYLNALRVSQPRAGSSVKIANVIGGKAQGALPITLEFPSAGTVAYAFEKAFLGDRQAELTIRCVRVGAALTLQGCIFVILSAVLVGVGLKAPRSALAVSCVFAVLCLFLNRFATPAIRPYYQCAIAATVLAAVIVVVQMGVTWRREDRL